MFKARRVYINWPQICSFRPIIWGEINNYNTSPSMPVHSLVDQLLMVELEKGFD
jgi:hypothetical protein